MDYHKKTICIWLSMHSMLGLSKWVVYTISIYIIDIRIVIRNPIVFWWELASRTLSTWQGPPTTFESKKHESRPWQSASGREHLDHHLWPDQSGRWYGGSLFSGLGRDQIYVFDQCKSCNVRVTTANATGNRWRRKPLDLGGRGAQGLVQRAGAICWQPDPQNMSLRGWPLVGTPTTGNVVVMDKG